MRAGHLESNLNYLSCSGIESDLVQETLRGENAECLSGSSEVVDHDRNQ